MTRKSMYKFNIDAILMKISYALLIESRNVEFMATEGYVYAYTLLVREQERLIFQYAF